MASNEPRRTKVLLLGLKRSGKSSIFQVLFKNLQPKQAIFINSTVEIVKYCFDTVIPVEVWDCPASVTHEQLAPLEQFSSIIFVIDMLDKQLYAQRLADYVSAFYPVNPNIRIEIFVHKGESVTDEFKFEMFRMIHDRVLDALYDLELTNPNSEPSSPVAFLEPEQICEFHLTSIYDHTINEAFSKVLHKLMEPISYLEELLNVFCANSRLAKAFLFDVNTRLYLATDASPVDAIVYGVCCDLVHVIGQLGPIYSAPDDEQGCGDCLTGSVQLAPNTTLAYWHITPDLAVLALLPSAVYQKRRGLMEYNLTFVRDGIREIVTVEDERRRGLNIGAPMITSSMTNTAG